MAPQAEEKARQPPAVDRTLLAPYLAAEGHPENGSVTVYFHAEGEQPPAGQEPTAYELRSIAYRLLEDLGVAIVAFNAPKNMHCFTPNQMMETFLVLEHARRDPRVNAVVWTSTGTKAFHSGAPLKGDQTVHAPEEVVKAYAARGLAPIPGDLVLTPQTKAFWDFPKPMVMAINGLAVGGGANVALANYADVVFCSRTARFMWPFAKLGLTPELGSSMMLPFLIGTTKGKELMMTGDWLSAEEAARLNLVSAVLEPEELLPHAVTFAAKVATARPTTLKLIKQVMNAPLREKLDEVLAREQRVILESVRAMGGSTLIGKKPGKRSKL